MYVGNLEIYQGIDLMLESFAMAIWSSPLADLVIVGGAAGDISHYERVTLGLGVEDKVHFVGPRPVKELGNLLSEADILISPRTLGTNTPMKIYSYLHSGKAILATDLPTHTQVLDGRVALLAKPTSQDFSKRMIELMQSAALRARLGEAGKKLAEEKYGYERLRKDLFDLYSWLELRVTVPALSS